MGLKQELSFYQNIQLVNIDRMESDSRRKGNSLEFVFPYLFLNNLSLKEIESFVQKIEENKKERVLKISNFDFFSSGILNIDINKAIIITGKKNMRNILILSEFSNLIHENTEPESFAKLFKYSLSVSIFATMISRRVFRRVASDFFLLGFFHNFNSYYSNSPNSNPFLFEINSSLKDSISRFPHSQSFFSELEKVLNFNTKANLDEFSGIVRIAIYFAYNIWKEEIDQEFEWILDGDLKNHLISNTEEYKIILMDFKSEFFKLNSIYTGLI